MMKLAPEFEWVRTSDPVIRSPARHRWTTAPAWMWVGFKRTIYSRLIDKLTRTQARALYIGVLGTQCDENNSDMENHMPYATACEETIKSHTGERIPQGGYLNLVKFHLTTPI